MTRHALWFYQALTAKRDSWKCSIFERYPQVEALRIARELRVLREYVRGDVDVIRDIARSFELYETLFAVSED